MPRIDRLLWWLALLWTAAALLLNAAPRVAPGLASGGEAGGLRALLQRIDPAPQDRSNPWPSAWLPGNPTAELLRQDLAALDRLESARELLKLAYAEVGKLPVLERARGVVLLRTPGAGLEALAALESAAGREPDLPFLGFPLAQARMLVGRELLAEDPDRALMLARLAIDYDPTNPDFRELEAEVVSDGVGEFDVEAVVARLGARVLELHRGVRNVGADGERSGFDEAELAGVGIATTRGGDEAESQHGAQQFECLH